MTTSPPITFQSYFDAEAHLNKLGFKFHSTMKGKHVFFKGDFEIGLIEDNQDYFTVLTWYFSAGDINILLDVFGK